MSRCRCTVCSVTLHVPLINPSFIPQTKIRSLLAKPKPVTIHSTLFTYQFPLPTSTKRNPTFSHSMCSSQGHAPCSVGAKGTHWCVPTFSRFCMEKENIIAATEHAVRRTVRHACCKASRASNRRKSIKLPKTRSVCTRRCV